MLKNIKNIRKISNIPENCLERYLALSDKYAHSLLSKGINFSGISNLRSGYKIGYSEPSLRHMFIFTKSGEGYLQTPTENFKLTRGTVISVPPGKSCMFGVSGDQWDILWFYILDVPCWKPLKNKGIEYKKTNMIPKLELSMEGFLSESQANDPEHKAACLFAELIVLYLDQAMEITQQRYIDEAKNKLEDLWQKVQENPARKWTKFEMAGKLHVSASTFDRMVKKYYNITPWQQVIQIRMDQAEMFLSKTDYPLQVIADRLGYANEFIFSSAFKKHSSQSPKFFRQKKNAFKMQLS